MFSASLSEKEFDAFADSFPPVLRETNRRILNPIWFLNHFLVKDSLEYERNIERLDAILFRMIEARKSSGKEYDDLLGMLMAARDEESGAGMSEKQLRDEVMTIFIAGHETTAQALCWALFLLDRRRDIRDQLEAEASGVLVDRLPTARDFMEMPYALKVFKETLRLYPPVALYVRCAIRPFDMAGYAIPAYTRFLIPPYMMHRDPAYWEQPDRFDPERFTPEAEKQRPKFVYFPFGGGPRICIGNKFAMMEAVFALAMIAQRFRVEPVAPEKVRVDFTLTLRPKGGLPARIVAKD
jgi:cytochrome P450